MFRINKLFYSPVKSLSFSSVKKLEILNNIGIKFDRNFAFTRDLDDNKINYILNNPLERQIMNFLSLKHLPELNIYNFDFETNFLRLKKIIILFYAQILIINWKLKFCVKKYKN